MSCSPSLKQNPAIVLGSGVFALILSMGIARFSYTPMIPYMQAQTGMGDALAGWLAGWNYFGYFVGVLLITRMSNLLLKDRVYRLGLILAVLSTFMMGFSDFPWLWGVSRFLAGVGTAAGLMLGSGLILHWLMQGNHRSELGLHFSGIGLGIALGAALTEWASTEFNWQWQWFLLGGLGCLVLIPALLYLPKPHDSNVLENDIKQSEAALPSFSWLTLLHIAYFCSGFAYVVYSTFIVVIIEKELTGIGVWLWCLLGLVAAPSAIFWDRVSRKIGYTMALQVAFIIKTASLLLLFIKGSTIIAVLSVVFFGGTFVGIVSMVLTMVGVRYPHVPAQIMAKLTISFCLAQMIGPVIAGEVAELTGSFNGSLMLGIGLMIIGLVCLQLLKKQS